MDEPSIVVKQVVMDIACYSDIDAAEQVKIALSWSPVFRKFDYDHGGCCIVGEPTCETSWSPDAYESITGIDVFDVE